MEHRQGVLVASASVVGTEQRGFRCPSTRKGLRPREIGGSAQTGAARRQGQPQGQHGVVCPTPPLTATSRTQDRAESVGYFIALIVPFFL